MEPSIPVPARSLVEPQPAPAIGVREVWMQLTAAQQQKAFQVMVRICYQILMTENKEGKNDQ